MSCMKDVLTTPTALGETIRAARKSGRLSATAVADRSGRARSLLYRLEAGDEVTVGAMLDILRAMGLGVRIEPLTLPTLDDVRDRFGQDDDDAA